MRLWIRVEANAQIGFGHLVRMLALAQAAIDKEWQVSLLSTGSFSLNIPASINVIIVDNDSQLLALSRVNKPDWLFVDGYHFNPQQCKVFNQLAFNLAHIDDLCQSYSLDSRLLVSPAGMDNIAFYTRQFPKAKRLCGLAYVLLRPEFKVVPIPYSERTTVMVTFGGADVANLSLQTVKILTELKVANIHLVVTDAMSIDLSSPLLNDVSVHYNVSATEMANLMSQARYAVGAAGSTMFELACHGVPSVFAIVADNQMKAAKELTEAGWCYNFDALATNTEQQLRRQLRRLLVSDLEKMHHLASARIDANGAQRVVEAMEVISGQV